MQTIHKALETSCQGRIILMCYYASSVQLILLLKNALLVTSYSWNVTISHCKQEGNFNIDCVPRATVFPMVEREAEQWHSRQCTTVFLN